MGKTNRNVLFLFLFLSGLFIKSVYAERMGVIHQGEFTILSENLLKPAVDEVSGVYPKLKTELETVFSWKLDFKPTLLLVRDPKVFQQRGGSDLIVGFAVPSKNLIVIDYSKMNLHPFTLETTLKHELCHLLLHRYIKAENLPRWLDEGVSQWASDGIAEIILSGRSVLDEASLTGKYILLDHLETGFPPEQRLLSLAYEQSRSFIDYLTRRFGRDKLLEILNHLKDGNSPETAFQMSIAVSPEELERQWHEYLRRKTTWFTYVSLHLYEILFFLTALLTATYGTIRILTQKKAYGRDDEEESEEDL